MIQYKQYLIIFFSRVTALLSVSAFISYSIDPNGIYNKSSADATPKSYVESLMDSSHGLIWVDGHLNWRDVKFSLAENGGYADCAVIGSSHAFQISSSRAHRSLKRICPSIINLGVPGASLEDYLALSQAVINNPNRPHKLVLQISPWALNLKRDIRWKRYKDAYFSMLSLINKRTITSSEPMEWEKLANLINPEYVLRALQSIGQEKGSITRVSEFNTDMGMKDPVFLPDGSFIYSEKYIREKANTPITVDENYKIDRDEIYSEAALTLFYDFIQTVQSQDIEVILLMTPYHHKVWSAENSATKEALIVIDKLLKKAGRDLNAKVLGAYNPNIMGCHKKEFFDFMHPKDSCLSKITN